MKHQTINGFSYACPFEGLFRPLSPEESADLEAGIVDVGEILEAVKTYRSEKFGLAIYDGLSRARIGERLDIEVPVVCNGAMTDARARQLARALHARRHLNKEEQAVNRAAAALDRRAKVTTGTAEGKSTRTMAAELGVSQPQILRDQASAAASGDTPVSPGKVHGADGKTYPPPPPKKTKSKRSRRKTAAAERYEGMKEHAKYLRKVLAAKDTDSQLACLQTLAACHEVPLSGRTWPAFDFEKVVLVFRDLARGMVSG